MMKVIQNAAHIMETVGYARLAVNIPVQAEGLFEIYKSTIVIFISGVSIANIECGFRDACLIADLITNGKRPLIIDQGTINAILVTLCSPNVIIKLRHVIAVIYFFGNGERPVILFQGIGEVFLLNINVSD